MKHLLIFLSILLLYSPLFGQSEKPKAIIIDTGSLGKISKTRIKILDKTLESKLDDYFSIVPKDEFEDAKEEAFKELEFDKCTEDQCIAKIQEILQVENALKMELTYEDGNTQISLTWSTLEQKRVEQNYCEGCNTKEMINTISGLVEALMAGRQRIKAEPARKEAAAFQEVSATGGFQARYGVALAYENLTFQTKTINEPINTSFNLFGFEVHSLLLPSRYRISLGNLSGSGKFTNRTAPFYLVVKSQLHTITSTSANLIKLAVTPTWQPGWIYSILWEQLKVSYSGSSGTLSSKRNSFSIEGGYEASELLNFLIDNNLFLETKFKYSTSSGFGITSSLGGLFF